MTASAKRARSSSRKKRISLALQGGGSHGAFTWGVLEALLEDGRFEFAGLSGTSAGGMNAAAMVQGLIQGGETGAIQSLEDFWRLTHDLARRTAPMFADPSGKSRGDHNLTTAPGMILRAFFEQMVGSVSPYAANPLNYNPFRSLVEDFFDFDAIRKSDACKLFLAATHVQTGKIRIFHNREISADSLMATSCVPTMFQAVEVDGEYYWDGGYVANPAIFPLIDECDAGDIVLVQLTSTRVPRLPRHAAEIKERFREITLNACLVREIRAIHLITRLIDEGKIDNPSMHRINLHVIKDPAAFSGMYAGSALNTDWDFLNALRRAGTLAAKRWIRATYRKLGTKIPFDQTILDDYL
ncbi:MAG: patatin-like phospholipase family protein [Betaproteobacteria bacterium]|nr:MAG: patatin-like phospholipase family protein [Betaproteobacteria bacterium]